MAMIPQGKSMVATPANRQEENIKIDLTEIGFKIC
jgi:hypothetical protein